MAETRQGGMEYSDGRKILAVVRGLGACLAAGGSDENIADCPLIAARYSSSLMATRNHRIKPSRKGVTS